MLNRRVRETLDFVPTFDSAVSEEWKKRGQKYVEHLMEHGTQPDGYLKKEVKATTFVLQPLTAEQFDLYKSLPADSIQKEKVAIRYGVKEIKNYQVKGKVKKFNRSQSDFGMAIDEEAIDELGYFPFLRSSIANMIENITYTFEA